MKQIIPFLFMLYSCSSPSNKIKVSHSDILHTNSLNLKVISDSTNILTGDTQNLELKYIVWGCACANWITLSDFDKYKDNKLAEHCIFIEPANDCLELPLFFDPSRHTIKVKGQFYIRSDYPKGTVQTEEQLEKARVFRYKTLEIEEKEIHYSRKDDKTLILNYNAIACTCAQWSESKYNNKPEKRERLYLERANNTLIDADTLFNGENLPVQIQVTGQIITENGYPTGYNFTKGSSEAGKVFRYSKIKVITNGHREKNH